MIGETGFEPATARPPAGCATRLRHSPWPLDDSRTAVGWMVRVRGRADRASQRPRTAVFPNFDVLCTWAVH